MAARILCHALLLPSVIASTLWVSSYGGNVTTLNLAAGTSAGTSSLTVTSSGAGVCGISPSWLIFNSTTDTLYCINEGINQNNGSLHSFNLTTHGALLPVSSVGTVDGGVNGVIYGKEGKRFMAIAHYLGAALTTYSLPEPTAPKALQQFLFTNPPGPKPQQDKPHPHETVLDPTGDFILVPDLGADLVRVYAIDHTTGDLTACPSLVAEPGSGPRHAVFWTPSTTVATGTGTGTVSRHHHQTLPGETFFYLVSELASTLTAFRVTYLNNTMVFAKIQTESSLGNSASSPTVAVAEVAIHGDHLLLSNRGDQTYGPGDDSLGTFALSPNGSFAFDALSPAYGSFPRQFSLNRAGTLIAVGLQNNGTVAIIARNPLTGLVGAKLAEIQLQVGVTSVIWDE